MPVLSRQRDHSACGRPETPLKVRKTRENLRAVAGYPDIPPPCVYGNENDSSIMPEMSRAPYMPHSNYCQQDTSTPTELSPAALRPLLKAERQKSVSQRMLSKVKQGINNRSKASLPVHAVEPEPSLIRRLSGRRKHSSDNERRAQSYEISRDSVGSIDEGDPEALSTEATMARPSSSDSTISTGELVVNCSSTPIQHEDHDPLIQTLYTSDRSSSQHGYVESSEQTPRPLTSRPITTAQARMLVPSINLTVTLEQTTVDCNLRADIWIAIEASVQAFAEPPPIRDSGMHSRTPRSDVESSGCVVGRISSLRLCYKPVQGCNILDIIGHKSMKDLKIGEKCSLFVKVRVHQVSRGLPTDCDDQNSLFTELESLIGTLTTELLHIEVRYRTTLLPYHNVVTVKHIAKVTRPQTESRWSIIGTYNDIEMSEQTHTKLAICIADTYPAERALRYLDRHLANELEREEPLQQIRRIIAAELDHHGDLGREAINGGCPTVVVTADESKPSTNELPNHESPLSSHQTGRDGSERHNNAMHNSGKAPNSAMSPPLLPVGPPLQISPSAMSMTTTSIAISAQTNDDARRVWQHIRCSSQSTNQLSSKAGQRIEDLEASDDRLKSLRDKALANKRSVGAETLKGWKWDGEMMNLGEAPWL